MQIKTTTGNQGFTLIELMIVVAIIAILAAIAVPSYQNSILKSKIQTAQADLVSLTSVIENSYSLKLSYPLHDNDDVDTQDEIVDLSEYNGWSPASEAADFEFKIQYKAKNAGLGSDYKVTATGKSSLAGCNLTLDSKNERTSVDGKCIERWDN